MVHSVQYNLSQHLFSGFSKLAAVSLLQTERVLLVVFFSNALPRHSNHISSWSAVARQRDALCAHSRISHSCALVCVTCQLSISLRDGSTCLDHVCVVLTGTIRCRAVGKLLKNSQGLVSMFE